MPIFTALFFILVGGAINGSFALPTKNIRQWRFENIWLNFALWGFLLLPWIGIFTIAPHVGVVYQNIPPNLLWILIGGGALFGIGQVCFAKALQKIGFGLGFVINIGLGTGLGFLIPLVTLHPEKILTPFGYVTFAGIFLMITGLLISYHAGKQRHADTQHTQPRLQSSQYHRGVLLAMTAGFCSAIQNFTFAATAHLQNLALAHGVNALAAAMIIWPVFLTFSFIPYGIYMLYLHYKNQSFVCYRETGSGGNGFLTMVMGLCWYCSLVCYSKASLLIGSLGPVVGWPLFMVMIILVSNFWGWRHHEWAHATPEVAQQALFAIGLLILAVAVFAYSATLA